MGSVYEDIFIVVAVSFTSEIKIEGEEEACNSEEDFDTDKFWMVVERMANEIRMTSVSCVGRRSKFAGSVEATYLPSGIWCRLLKNEKSTWQKSCKKNTSKENKKFLSWQQNWQIKEKLMKTPGP